MITMEYHTIDLLDKINSLTDKNEKCWLWLGSFKNDIPCLKFKGKQYNPARALWESTNKKSLGRSKTFRECSNKLCINPIHLKSLGTSASLDDVIEKHIFKRDKCIIWTGNVNKKTPVIFYENARINVRKYIWENANNFTLKANQKVTTTCSEGLCIKSDHLHAVSEPLLYMTDRERVQNYRKEYYKKNKSFVDSLNKKWRENNKEKHLKLQQDWYQAHKEEHLERSKQWSNDNLGKKANYRRNRRAKIAQAKGRATEAQIDARMAYFGYRCYYCKGPFEEVDHTIPISNGGTNWPSNLRPTCKSCNRRKGTKTVSEFTRCGIIKF